MRGLLLLFAGLSGCAILETLEDPPPPNCDPRVAWYPDADGDGLGERTSVYVGCLAPEGWVSNLEPLDTDTGDLDTDVADTDVADTDVADTDTDVTDTDTDAQG